INLWTLCVQPEGGPYAESSTGAEPRIKKPNVEMSHCREHPPRSTASAGTYIAQVLGAGPN
ncbi:hypothetical protein L9F63_011943, partial [Diploptera punctata]